MTDRSALVPHVSPPAIRSAHNARGYVSLQLEAHRNWMERRRLSMPEPSPVKKRVVAPEPEPPAPEPILVLPSLDIEARAETLRLYANRLAEKQRLTINDIQCVVSARYGVTDMLSVGKRGDFKFASGVRQIAMYLAKILIRPSPSLQQIGRAFKRNHATAHHSIAKIEGLCAKDVAFCEEVEDIKRFLMGKLSSLPLREPSPDPAQSRRIGPGAAAKVLEAMRAGASTAVEVALALDITVQSVTGGISGLLRSGKIVQTRKVYEGGRSGRKFCVYALSEGEA